MRALIASALLYNISSCAFGLTAMQSQPHHDILPAWRRLCDAGGSAFLCFAIARYRLNLLGGGHYTCGSPIAAGNFRWLHVLPHDPVRFAHAHRMLRELRLL
jgi:hypothetical protein